MRNVLLLHARFIIPHYANTNLRERPLLIFMTTAGHFMLIIVYFEL